MSESVAGKIRIDVLMNTAGLSSGAKSGGNDIGGFAQECERAATKIEAAQKRITKATVSEREAWANAMRGTGAPLAGINEGVRSDFAPGGLMSLSPNQVGWQRQDKLLRQGISSSPWGMSTVSSLSAAQAELAARRGAEMGLGGGEGMGAGGGGEEGMGGGEGMGAGGGGEEGMGGGRGFGRRDSMRFRELGRAILGRGAMRPLAEMGVASEGLSTATMGLAGFAGGAMIAQHAAAELGNEIKNLREQANALGMTYDELAAKKGLPAHSRFVEGGALGATSGWEGAKGIGAAAFGGLMKYGYMALGLPGFALNAMTGGALSGDPEAIAANARDEESEALAKRKKITDFQQSEGALGKMESELRSIQGLSADLSREDFIANFSPQPAQLQRWDDLTAKIRAARVASVEKELGHAAMSPQERGLDELQDRLDKLGITTDKFGMISPERDRLTDQYRSNVRKAESQKFETPEEKYGREMSEARRLHADRMMGEETYARARLKFAQDYYREVENLDAKSIRKRLQSGYEKYAQDAKNLQAHGGAIGLTPDEIRRAGQQDANEERKRLGLRNPLDDFAQSMGELNKARRDPSLHISDKEYSRRAEQLRQQATSELGDQQPQHVQLAPAAAAGSREAYSTIANAMTTNPQTEANRRIAKSLDDIKKAIESGNTLTSAMLEAMEQAVL